MNDKINDEYDRQYWAFVERDMEDWFDEFEYEQDGIKSIPDEEFGAF